MIDSIISVYSADGDGGDAVVRKQTCRLVTCHLPTKANLVGQTIDRQTQRRQSGSFHSEDGSLKKAGKLVKWWK